MNSSTFTVWSYNVNVAIMGILAWLPDPEPASYHSVMADTGLQVGVGTFTNASWSHTKLLVRSVNDVLKLCEVWK